jgi:RimJ/RimL family protein N-acetyltransferase
MVSSNLKLIKNEQIYYDFIRVLRTHPENTKGFLEQVELTQSQQNDYMSKYSKNYWICLSGDTPVGFIGVVDEDIRLAVEPNFKNKGIGTFMVGEILKINKSVTAKVLLENISSQKTFEKNNFKNYKTDEIFKYYKYDSRI